ncbi:MAG: DUF3568 family protein [Sedimentisphaerales bacterium]|nr:DUF3568 family protein [Sedimentisphaerales bacterium]
MLAKRIVTIVVLAGMLLPICGCAPSLVGSDTAAYSAGKLYAVVSKDMSSVYDATVTALEQLEIEPYDKAKDVFSAKIIAKSADGKIISVKLTPGAEGQTKLSIRIGTVGNRERATVIYNRINENLGLAGK